MYRGRFAPSPTGDLHLGTAATALVAWLSARAAGGRFVLRVEDIDEPRVVPGVEARQLDDLRWLGLDWDEGPDVGGPHAPYRQSERHPHYEAALAHLERQGLVYRCDCSRAEIARVASAPHQGDDGPRYPGTCRTRPPGPWRRPPALRLRVPDRDVTIHDALHGPRTQNVAEAVGDFVLKRGDGAYAYQLAVVVDDLDMQITEVVRAFDLLTSAPRQALLANLLGGHPPTFAHVPLLVNPDGSRLAKRTPSTTIADHRRHPPEALVGHLAHALGLARSDEPISVRDLLPTFNRSSLRDRPEIRLAP